MAISSRQVFTDDFSLPPSPPLTNSTASRGLGQLLTFYFLLLLFLYPPLLLLSPFLTAPLPSTLTLSFASLLRSFHVHALVIFLVNPLPPFARRIHLPIVVIAESLCPGLQLERVAASQPAQVCALDTDCWSEKKGDKQLSSETLSNYYF